MLLPLSIPSPGIDHLQLGPIRIQFYALCILVGIVVAVLLTNHRLTKRGAERWVVLDFAFWGVLLGIIGARAYHVLSHYNDYFGPTANQNWWAIWEGGIAIFGALIGGGIGVFIACRMTGIRFLSFADALAPGLLIAQGLGRFGNWFNHELFGAPTTLPWGLEIESTNPAWPQGLPEGTLFHPTFLYEMLWNFLGAAVIILLERRLNLRWGRAFALYLIWYGIGRSFTEAIRLDPSQVLFGIRTNIWAAWLAVLVGLVILIVQARRHPGLELGVYAPGRGPAAKGAAVSSDDADSYYVLDADGAIVTTEPATEPEPATSGDSART